MEKHHININIIECRLARIRLKDVNTNKLGVTLGLALHSVMIQPPQVTIKYATVYSVPISFRYLC